MKAKNVIGFCLSSILRAQRESFLKKSFKFFRAHIANLMLYVGQVLIYTSTTDGNPTGFNKLSRSYLGLCCDFSDVGSDQPGLQTLQYLQLNLGDVYIPGNGRRWRK